MGIGEFKLKIKNMTRGVYFEESDKKRDKVFDFKSAYSSWNLKGNIYSNSNELKKALKVNDIVMVRPKLLNSEDESDDTLRLYVCEEGHYDIKALTNNKLSHGIQISLGEENNRKNWVCAEGSFTAKVYVDTPEKLLRLIEDVILDIQMFYFWGFERVYDQVEERRIFSLKKVEFLKEKAYSSYLGDIANAQYVSFASFCRDIDNLEIDYNKYVQLWEEFNEIVKETISYDPDKFEGFYPFSADNLEQMILIHPKGKQLSIKKIKKILKTMPSGEYILVRTEKKPKKSRQRIKIESWLSMKKWKTGKIKIIPKKYYYTARKLVPYVSIFEFNWRG